MCKARKSMGIFSIIQLFVLIFGGVALAAGAEDFPTRPVHAVIGYKAGGMSDLTLRPLIAVAHQYMGQPMVAVLKPGASATIAANYVAKSKPDGHTLFLGDTTSTNLLPQREKLPYKHEDLLPVCQITYSGLFAYTAPDSPFKTFKDVVEYAKKNPGAIKWHISGSGNQQHLWLEGFSEMVGMKVNVVPFPGDAPGIAAVLGKHIHMGFAAEASLIDHFKKGTLKGLAITRPERWEKVPDVPTVMEIYPELNLRELYSWKSVFVPRKTPDAIVKKLEDYFHKMVNDKSYVRIMNRMDMDIKWKNTEEFTKAWEEEFKFYTEMLTKLGLIKK